MKQVYKELPLRMPSMRGTVSCTGCGRLIGRGEGQSFYRIDADDEPVGPAMCYACAQRLQVETERDDLSRKLDDLRTTVMSVICGLADNPVEAIGAELQRALERTEP